MSPESPEPAADDAPTVLAIVGSPRRHGNSSFLVDVALDELARTGVAVEKMLLAEYHVLPCEGHDACEDFAACPRDDDAAGLLERMYAADGLILATPVYYENVAGQMKVFLDRSCFNNYHETWLRARAVGLIAVAESTGLDDALDALRRFVALASDHTVRPLAVSGLAYREGDAERNTELVGEVRIMAATMAATLLRLPS